MPRKKATPQQIAQRPVVDDESALDESALDGDFGGSPPPAPAPPTEEGEPPPEEFLALGPPPKDNLAAQEWAYRAMLIAMHSAMLNPKLSNRDRNRELRTCAAAAERLVPNKDLWEARELIKRDKAEQERRATERGARMEKRAAAPAGAKVIPIRGGGG